MGNNKQVPEVTATVAKVLRYKPHLVYVFITLNLQVLVNILAYE